MWARFAVFQGPSWSFYQMRALSRGHPIRIRRRREISQRHQDVCVVVHGGRRDSRRRVTDGIPGKDLGRVVDVFATAFPDIRRDSHHVYETGDRGST